MRRLLLAALMSSLAAPAFAGPGGLPKSKMPRPPEDTQIAAAAPARAAPAEAADPYIWLEQVDSPQAMAWVNAHNQRALDVLEKDPHYPELYQQALTLAEDKDRIPSPRFIGAEVYNFWQDAEHVRGIWRKTTLADYANPQPHWTTVLDLDALAKAENANWVWKGANCEQPGDRLCLIELSDGGEDAVTVREFDLAAGRFVPGGFVLPRSKQRVDWLDDDTVLVSRDWGPGTMTASGYPFVVKLLKRGEPLSAAREVFRGQATDQLPTEAQTFVDAQERRATILNRGVTFFEFEQRLLTPSGAIPLPLPPKSSVVGLVDGRLVARIEQDWAPGIGAALPAGALISLDLNRIGPSGLSAAPQVIYAPGPRESLGSVDVSAGKVIASIYENVRGRAFVFTPAPGGWTRTRLALPDNASIGVVSASDKSDDAFLTVTSYLTPTTLWFTDADTGALRQVKALPPKFDASRDVVEQFEATSKDGTRIPYFVVRPREMKFDGSNPTLLYAYGGFQISETPAYSASIGKLWLERGGVYVVANIRGGGEFGPAWHEAGLKTKRQVIYDDFAAVAEDLIRRGITSPRRLGIRGGSNGGLLMGVELTQHPELWNAVVIDIPLLDMLRFEKIAAGASWVGEYGTVSNPRERAFLASISPYNNLRAGVRYPEPFIFTTTKDDRVGPQHARKFAARMEEMGLPYLFYENTEGGHGAGANLRQQARTQALEMTYLIRKLME